jgi:hypothetical protein
MFGVLYFHGGGDDFIEPVPTVGVDEGMSRGHFGDVLRGCNSSPSMKGKWVEEAMACAMVVLPHPAGPPTMNRGIPC